MLPDPTLSFHKSAHSVAQLGYRTPISIIFALLMYLLFVPCDLCNFGYMYYPTCSSSAASNYENQFVFIAATFLRYGSPCFLAWVIIHTYAHWTLECCIFTSIHCYSLINYVNLFFKLHLKNCKDNFDKSVKMFKEIQLLTFRYNRIHQGPLTLAVITLTAFVFIISFYAVIEMNKDLVLPMLFLYSGLAFNTVVIIIVNDGTFKTGVLMASKEVLAKVSNHAAGSIILNKSRRLQTRYIRSWSLLKIYTGSVNFYEEETALILLNFNINQVVSLLML